MNKDQALGLLLFLGSVVGAILYMWLVFLSPWQMLVLQLTAFFAVGFILFILGWIGYTLATTPPPKPIEEIEKEIESVKEEQPPVQGTATPGTEEKQP
ncbi:MAG: transcriptional regulator [Candidatus Brockarchaeota archaeon]|nr:transcriptional regulator [Candidatus Brockarchaeota archaeon]